MKKFNFIITEMWIIVHGMNFHDKLINYKSTIIVNIFLKHMDHTIKIHICYAMDKKPLSESDICSKYITLLV